MIGRPSNHEALQGVLEKQTIDDLMKCLEALARVDQRMSPQHALPPHIMHTQFATEHLTTRWGKAPGKPRRTRRNEENEAEAAPIIQCIDGRENEAEAAPIIQCIDGREAGR